ncbi:MAG: hypothetical protein ABI605_09365 [Rhizobacter sp.]
MNWISVVVSAVCGALGGVLATLVVRDRKSKRGLYAAVFVVSAGLLFALGRVYVTPWLQARYDASTLDSALSSNAAFAAIKKFDPKVYDQMMSELRAGLLRGQGKAELIDLVRSQVTTLVQKRLPHASDEAASEYMRVMVREMGELRQRGGDLCYRFLFAQPGQGLDLSKYVSPSTVEADFAALSQVVRTSTVEPQPIPQQAEVSERLKPVVAALAARYGQDLALLQQPQAPGIDRDKLCAMSIDMYTVILQLPPADSGKLIRFLMMGQG